MYMYQGFIWRLYFGGETWLTRIVRRAQHSSVYTVGAFAISKHYLSGSYTHVHVHVHVASYQ